MADATLAVAASGLSFAGWAINQRFDCELLALEVAVASGAMAFSVATAV